MINNEVIIRIENLSKSYKTKNEIKKIADNLNMEIKQKDKIGLLGKNGVGKTTILNMIIGKIKPDSGKIIFNSEIIFDPLKDISYLQQSFKFPNFFKVKDIKNLVIQDIEQKKIYDENLIRKINNVLGIEFLINKKYQKLSGGEKQKINLFSVIACNPKILILDEFSNNIDLETSLAIRKIIKEIDIAVIIVSHNIYEIIDICKKVILLENGKIKKEFLESEINETNLKNSLISFPN